MIIIKCQHCDAMCGPVNFAPAPPHYNLVDPEAEGWLRGEGNKWDCPIHRPDLQQLPLWEDRDESSS